MASACLEERKCFTFVWKITNADHWDGYMRSPIFTAGEIESTKWRLVLGTDYNDKYYDTYLRLRREEVDEGPESVIIDWEFAFLSGDGAVLHSKQGVNAGIEKNRSVRAYDCPSWFEVFRALRSAYLSEDTLTVRCRLWRSDGEFLQNSQCIARTRVTVERGSFLTNIEDFEDLPSPADIEYKIKSPSNGKEVLLLKLLIPNEGKIKLKISPICENTKLATLQLFVVDNFENYIKALQATFRRSGSNEFVMIYTWEDIIDQQDMFLHDGRLYLLGEFSYPVGTTTEEIEYGVTNSRAIERVSQDYHCPLKTKDFSASKDVLVEEFKSILNSRELSDVKLKARSKTFYGHKCILGVRSPVFKAMFSNDMKENIKDCVDIDDFSDETVSEMLRYIYSADVGELEWGGATELYEAADKYQILKLKDICSSFLERNLSATNACEALGLADLHHDEALKRFVQDYILKHGRDVIFSEEWSQLMETNSKLAAETMRLKFKE